MAVDLDLALATFNWLILYASVRIPGSYDKGAEFACICHLIVIEPRHENPSLFLTMCFSDKVRHKPGLHA